MSYKNTLLITIIFVLLIAHESPIFAAYQEPADRAALPAIELSAISGDNTARLQQAIDQTTAKHNGGRILLKKGTYSLSNVILKSNVHIEVETGTVITPYEGTKGGINLFEIGREADHEIRNVSIRGIGGRYNIVYPQGYTRDTRAFLIANVNNLLLRDINITEQYTKFSAIAFVLPAGATAKTQRAKNVTVTQVSLKNSLYGYGLVQANAGQDMLFSDLISTDAGVTVRIETDLLSNNQYNIGVDNIMIHNVTNANGHAAVFMQPHSIQNGDVKADGVVAMESGIGVAVFKNNGRFPGLPDGSFGSGSYVRNISVVYGTRTPMSTAKIKYMPLSLREQIEDRPADFYDIYRKGPSVAAVINLLPKQVSITDSDIKHSGPNLLQYTKIVTNELSRARSARRH